MLACRLEHDLAELVPLVSRQGRQIGLPDAAEVVTGGLPSDRQGIVLAVVEGLVIHPDPRAVERADVHHRLFRQLENDAGRRPAADRAKGVLHAANLTRPMLRYLPFFCGTAATGRGSSSMRSS